MLSLVVRRRRITPAKYKPRTRFNDQEAQQNHNYTEVVQYGLSSEFFTEVHVVSCPNIWKEIIVWGLLQSGYELEEHTS